MRSCRSCRAPVTWVTLPSGKTMPLDAEPAADGNVALLSAGRAIVLTAGELSEERQLMPPFRRKLYRSHFSTCPQAKQFRRGKGASR